MISDRIRHGVRVEGQWRTRARWSAAVAALLLVFAATADAQPRLDCGSPVSARLAPGAVDTYRVGAPAGSVVSVEVADVQASLGLVRLKAVGANGEESCSGSLQLRVEADTRIEVSDCIGGSSGDYTVTLNGVSDDGGNCGDPLPCGGTSDGLAIEVPGEVRAFTFDGRAGDPVTIASTPATRGGPEVKLRVFGPDGAPVEGADSCAALRTVRPKSDGRHTVLVSSCGRPQTVPFRLTLEASDCPSGPHITYFGVSSADNQPLNPASFDEQGRPVYVRPLGQGLEIVVEGRPGASGRRVGGEGYAHDPANPEVLPDLQMLVSRPLGFGTGVVCDNMLPALSGIPATTSLAFDGSQGVANAVNDLGCRVNDGTGAPLARLSEIDACTRSASTAEFHFVDPGSTVQFCMPIARAWAFPPGDTVVKARLRDEQGSLGAEREIVVRVGGALPYEIADVAPFNLVEAGGLLYFAANDGRTGTELWVSDGTIAGTHEARDIAMGPSGSFPRDLVDYRNRVYFLAQDTTDDWRLWESTGGYTGRVGDLDAGFIAPARQLVRAASHLYYFVENGAGGLELWSSNGTAVGSAVIRSVGGASSIVQDVAVNGDTILFAVATLGGSLVDLWRSDGTLLGTRIVRSFDFGDSTFTELGRISPVGDGFYFVAGGNRSGGFALWKSDGTESGTFAVAPLTPARDGSLADDFTVIGEVVYFTGYTAASGIELWRTDGTPEGTGLVVDSNPGADSSTPSGLVAIGDTLYFGAYAPQYGRELWSSDGTSAGTRLVRDIRSGPQGSDPASVTAIADYLFFSANDGVNGREVWVSDGSEAGTVSALDIAPGPRDSSPISFTLVGNRVMFAATTGTDFALWGVTVPGGVVSTCAGDKDGNGQVTIDELLRGVGAAGGSIPVSECPSFDANGDGVIEIGELVTAVGNGLHGCPEAS